jgi:hypothetical protein
MKSAYLVRPIALSFAFFGTGLVVDDDHKPSYPIDAEAEAFVAKRAREEYLRDEVFIASLQELAKSKLSPAAKADAFALMQQQVGWLFAGCMKLFPAHGYFQSQTLILSTYFRYQQKMPDGIDPGCLQVVFRLSDLVLKQAFARVPFSCSGEKM